MDRKVVVAGVAVLGLAVASCGSSSSEPMTKAEFTKAAHKICVHRRAEYAAVQARYRDDLRHAVAAAVPALESTVNELDDLRPPAELRAAFADVMAWERHQVVIAKQFVSTGKAPAGSTEHGPRLHRHERERLQLGMSDCAG